MEAIKAIFRQAKVKVVTEVTVGPQTVFIINCREKKAARIARRIWQQTDFSATTGYEGGEGTQVWCAPESLNPFRSGE